MRRFELIDDQSRKFWEIAVRQAELTTRFGRLGSVGTRRTKTCSSEAAALADAAKLIREKTSKGYVEVTVAAETGPGLSHGELDAVAEILESAATEYDGHSSNDYEVPANDGNRSVIEATIAYGNRLLAEDERQRFGDFLERDGQIFIWDSWLMHYLAQRCRGIVAAVQIPSELNDAESAVLATLLDDLARDEYGEDFTLAATEENRALLIATVRHWGGPDVEARVSALTDADDVVGIDVVALLRWLAVRCRASAGHPSRLSRSVSVVDSLGILKSWISEKTLVKRATEMDESWIPAYAKNDVDLETYANGGNPFREYKQPNVPCVPPFAGNVCNPLFSYERMKRTRNVVLSLFGNRLGLEWQHEYDRMVAYDFWKLVTEIQANGYVEFGECVAVLAHCVYSGHWQRAKYLAVLLQGALVGGNVWMDDALTLYQWWIRICCEYFQLHFDPSQYRAYAQRIDLYTQGECFGEPVLNELAGHWRDTDLSPLSLKLIWLCDYYTHRTRYQTSPEPKTEFGNSWLPVRLPIVILAWFRLREALGLENPEIEHPLMKARYARLYAPRPPFSEDVLERVIARLKREELPMLGDFEDPTIHEPKRWRIFSFQRESNPFASVVLEPMWAVGYSIFCDLPAGCMDRSTPEMLRYVESASGTEFSFIAYKNPGITVTDWAELALAHVARSAPKAQLVAPRTWLPSRNWTGMAEEFRGFVDVATDADRSAEPSHHLVAAGKSYSTLLVVHIVARQEVFAANAAFYRWLLEWKVGISVPARMAVVSGRRQDIPGFERIAPDPSWMDAEKQFEIGLLHYHGRQTTEAARSVSRDRSLAAVWFERAAEQDHGNAQFNLAILLKNADGVAKDVPTALLWAKKARLRGVAKAPQLIRELETLIRQSKPFWKIW